jgi:hypothetical protein
MREWTFMVSYPADLAWLWKRVCEVIGSPDPLGIWLWLGLFVIGLGLAGVFAIARLWHRLARRQAGTMPAPSVSVPREGRRGYSLPDAVLFASVTLSVGVTGYALFLLALHYYTQPWYYITLLAVVAGGLDVLFGSWPVGAGFQTLPLFLRTGRLAVAIALLSFAALPDWEEMLVRHTNADLIVARLRLLATNHDVLLVARWECAIPLARYYRGPAGIISIPPIEDHRFHRYDLVLREMMTPNPLRPIFARLEKALRTGHQVFIAGPLAFPDRKYPLPDLPPAYRDRAGIWHGGAYDSVWQLQVGQFLGAHASSYRRIAVPVPGSARVQEFETLDLAVATGWR